MVCHLKILWNLKNVSWIYPGNCLDWICRHSVYVIFKRTTNVRRTHVFSCALPYYVKRTLYKIITARRYDTSSNSCVCLTFICGCCAETDKPIGSRNQRRAIAQVVGLGERLRTTKLMRAISSVTRDVVSVSRGLETVSRTNNVLSGAFSCPWSRRFVGAV